MRILVNTRQKKKNNSSEINQVSIYQSTKQFIIISFTKESKIIFTSPTSWEIPVNRNKSNVAMCSVWLEQHNMVNLAGWGRGGGEERQREGGGSLLFDHSYFYYTYIVVCTFWWFLNKNDIIANCKIWHFFLSYWFLKHLTIF